MDPLTLTFDLAAAIGVLYLAVGLALHLIAAWKTCALSAAAVATPVVAEQHPSRPSLSQTKRSELKEITEWNQRFGLT